MSDSDRALKDDIALAMATYMADHIRWDREEQRHDGVMFFREVICAAIEKFEHDRERKDARRRGYGEPSIN